MFARTTPLIFLQILIIFKSSGNPRKNFAKRKLLMFALENVFCCVLYNRIKVHAVSKFPHVTSDQISRLRISWRKCNFRRRFGIAIRARKWNLLDWIVLKRRLAKFSLLQEFRIRYRTRFQFFSWLRLIFRKLEKKKTNSKKVIGGVLCNLVFLVRKLTPAGKRTN